MKLDVKEITEREYSEMAKKKGVDVINDTSILCRLRAGKAKQVAVLKTVAGLFLITATSRATPANGRY